MQQCKREHSGQINRFQIGKYKAAEGSWENKLYQKTSEVLVHQNIIYEHSVQSVSITCGTASISEMIHHYDSIKSINTQLLKVNY